MSDEECGSPEQLSEPEASDSKPSSASRANESEEDEMSDGADSEGVVEPHSGGDGGGKPERAKCRTELEKRRQENIRAMLTGDGLELSRQALLPKLLTVQQAAVVLRRPFKSPHPDAPAISQACTSAPGQHLD
jgi:DNA repair and recombination RAD54-like protein